MSAKGQFRTHALQKNRGVLFWGSTQFANDELVALGELKKLARVSPWTQDVNKERFKE
jgi:hypothetical protein